MKLSQIQALSQEFAALLTGARLQGLRQHGPAGFSLELYAQDHLRYFLWIDLQRPQSGCFLVQDLPPTQPAGALTQALRKHLLDSRLQAITQLAEDRVLYWDWQSTQGRYRLVLELTGRHANLFLLDAEGQILQQLHRDGSQRSLHRHRQYLPPEPRPCEPAKDPLKLAAAAADGSRSRVLADFEQKQARLRLQQQWLRQAQTALERQRRRDQQVWQGLQQDLAGLDQAQILQRQGELLQSAYGKVVKGQCEVTLIDYFQPDQPLVTLALNPTLSLAANIQKCFRLSRKREKAAERALELLDAAEARLQADAASLNELNSWQARSTAGEPLPDEILSRLQALIPPARPQAAKAHQPATRLPYREFVSASGHRILVGRTARDNDILTFRLARGNDLWLHVRDWPGSHVIVPLGKNQLIDPETLLDAASLALHYSEAQAQPLAEVSYTSRKLVQKIKGGQPGQVHLASSKTLSLRSEPARLDRLLKSS